VSEIRLTKRQLEILEAVERIEKKLRKLRRRFLEGWEIDAFINRRTKRTRGRRRRNRR
jgi:hypothetical protein